MSTPTDPYNLGSRRPFDDEDEVLAPISEEPTPAPASEITAETSGDLEWDQVFTAESAALAAGIESAEEVSGEPSFPSVATPTPENLAENTAHTEPAASILDAPIPALNPTESTENPAPFTPVALDADPTPEPELPACSLPVASSENTGYNTLPAAERANATLGDVVTAHSADEASFQDLVKQEQALASGETFSSAYAQQLNGSTISTTPEVAPGVSEATSATDATLSTASATAVGFMANANLSTSETGTEWLNETEDPQIPEAPKGRWGAHIGMFFLTLLLLPVGWYLISDAGARLALVANNPWETNTLNIWAILELVGGFAVFSLALLLTASSTFGLQFFGLVLTAFGLTAIISPSLGKHIVGALDQLIGDYNALTGNVVHHLNLDLASGRIAFYGALLLLAGLGMHIARKKGAKRSEAIVRREFLISDK